MKKAIITFIILAIIIGAAAIFITIRKQQNAEPVQIACTMEAKICPDGTSVGRTGPTCEFAACPLVVGKDMCYSYHQLATPKAPYSVDEIIKVSMGNEVVVGTKEGSQSGPDMSNGYEGTITGTRNGNIINAIFAYTIEGSTNSEQEEYLVTDTSLIKHRYPLIDQNGILVPDTTKAKTDIIYKEISCQDSTI